MRIRMMLALAAVMACAGYAPGFAQTYAERLAKMPPEVGAFFERRLECDYWRSEYPYDEERRKQIDEALDQTCKGTDAELAALRKKYKGRPDILEILSDFEDNIEP